VHLLEKANGVGILTVFYAIHANCIRILVRVDPKPNEAITVHTYTQVLLECHVFTKGAHRYMSSMCTGVCVVACEYRRVFICVRVRGLYALCARLSLAVLERVANTKPIIQNGSAYIVNVSPGFYCKAVLNRTSILLGAGQHQVTELY
jgi:hypothetical protein